MKINGWVISQDTCNNCLGKGDSEDDDNGSDDDTDEDTNDDQNDS